MSLFCPEICVISYTFSFDKCPPVSANYSFVTLKVGICGAYLIGHVRILTVILETSIEERLMRRNLFECKLFPLHEPPSHARSSPTVRIRIRSKLVKSN